MKTIMLKVEFELHKKLKLKVTNEDTNMQEKIIELIKEYVEGE